MGRRWSAGGSSSADDIETRPRVLIIDELLARRFWPNGDALGKRMYFPADIKNLIAKPKEDQMMTIVGVIEPMRLRGLVDAGGDEQDRRVLLRVAPGAGAHARAGGAHRAGARQRDQRVRREIAQIDPELPFYGVRTMEERLATSLMDRRTPMLLATGFAGSRCSSPRSASTACSRIRCRSAAARSASAWRSAPRRAASSAWCCAKAD